MRENSRIFVLTFSIHFNFFNFHSMKYFVFAILFAFASIGQVSCSKEKPLTEEESQSTSIPMSGKWSEIKRITTIVADTSTQPISSDTVETKRGIEEIQFSNDLVTYFFQSKRSKDRHYIFDGSTLTIYNNTAQDIDAEKYAVTKTDSDMKWVMTRRTNNGLMNKDETTTIFYVKQ